MEAAMEESLDGEVDRTKGSKAAGDISNGQQDEVKVNGEVNGSCDEKSSIHKKLTSSELPRVSSKKVSSELSRGEKDEAAKANSGKSSSPETEEDSLQDENQDLKNSCVVPNSEADDDSECSSEVPVNKKKQGVSSVTNHNFDSDSNSSSKSDLSSEKTAKENKHDEDSENSKHSDSGMPSENCKRKTMKVKSSKKCVDDSLEAEDGTESETKNSSKDDEKAVSVDEDSNLDSVVSEDKLLNSSDCDKSDSSSEKEGSVECTGEKKEDLEDDKPCSSSSDKKQEDKNTSKDSDDLEIEEVVPTDPLAEVDPLAETPKKTSEGDKKTEQTGKDEKGLTDHTYSEAKSTEKLKVERKKSDSRKNSPYLVTPRRSSRNINKQKSYKDIDKDSSEDEDIVANKDKKPDTKNKPAADDDSDIEEVVPTDPLGGADPFANLPTKNAYNEKLPKTLPVKKTIVVSDAKSLVEMAASKKNGRKEPTLVIIDTNSILSGRGPVPVSDPSSKSSTLSTKSLTTTLKPSLTTTLKPGPKSSLAASLTKIKSQVTISAAVPISTSISATISPVSSTVRPSHQATVASYSTLPVAVPAQGMYSTLPPNATVTAVSAPMQSTPPAPPVTKPAPSPNYGGVYSPTLTDDMYVVEAPSFIVPYVYEKPAETSLKACIEKLEKQIKELEEEERKKKEEDEKKLKEEQKKKDSEKAEDEASKDEEDKKDDEAKKDTDKDTKEDKEKSTKDDKEKSTKDDKEKSTKDEKENEDKQDEEKENKAGDAKANTDTEKEKGADDAAKSGKVDEKSGKKHIYFDSPLGKFFIDIGLNLVQEHVQTDLLRSQKRKLDKEGGRGSTSTQFAINSLLKNLEFSKETNESFHFEAKKCEYCSFKTESSLVMAHHLETPHMRNYIYKCNFCSLEVRSPHDILFHMEAEHNVRGRLERAPAFHQCPSCPFEDNQKGKLSRHVVSCQKKFRAERNQEPPPDWEPPAKIPRTNRGRPPTTINTASFVGQMRPGGPHPLLPKLVPAPSVASQLSATGPTAIRGRIRGGLQGRYMPEMKPVPRSIAPTQIRQGFAPVSGMIYRPTVGSTNQQVLLPTSYQITGNQIYQVVGNQSQVVPMMAGGLSTVPRYTFVPPSSSNSTIGSAQTPTPVALVPNIASGSNSITIQSASNKTSSSKVLQQPSISITPLPRQPSGVAPPPNSTQTPQQSTNKPGQPGNKSTFVICEICDGYIKDLEQLRNHMQWIHKVKIHPKMIYNRPPLNCQKCQFRFFTDQGLERHLLGAHGLVTSSMQEAANKGKDGGRCPVCGRVYQWKLLNHVARDHNMTLKPAHLSYKCTVCTATFGMYKQFENHVYSAHSVVAKRSMDKKSNSNQTTSSQPARSSSTPQATDALLKPLKINDEITIIPQPAKASPKPESVPEPEPSEEHICEICDTVYESTEFEDFINHYKCRHLRECGVKLCKIDQCPTCKEKHMTEELLDYIEYKKDCVDVIELSDDEVVVAGQGKNEITITKIAPPGPKCFKRRLQEQARARELARQKKIQIIEIEDSPVKNPPKEESEKKDGGNKVGENVSNKSEGDALTAVKEKLKRRRSLEISQVEDSDGDSSESKKDTSEELPPKKLKLDEEGDETSKEADRTNTDEDSEKLQEDEEKKTDEEDKSDEDETDAKSKESEKPKTDDDETDDAQSEDDSK